jgi:hypothetical protein
MDVEYYENLITEFMEDSEKYFPINYPHYILSIKSLTDRIFKQYTDSSIANPYVSLEITDVPRPIQEIRGSVNVNKVFTTMIDKFKSVDQLHLLLDILIDFRNKTNTFKGFPQFNGNLIESPHRSVRTYSAVTNNQKVVVNQSGPVLNNNSIILIYRTMNLDPEEKASLMVVLEHLNFYNEMEFWKGRIESIVDPEVINVYRRFKYKGDPESKFKMFMILNAKELNNIHVIKQSKLIKSKRGELSDNQSLSENSGNLSPGIAKSPIGSAITTPSASKDKVSEKDTGDKANQEQIDDDDGSVKETMSERL